ncbi:MAG: glycosyltransferase [Anaerolineae bacterium]|nr:glycosyltransferase [Anaerolineae bacterium]
MPPLGINLIADLRLNTGIGEANRNLADALLAQEIEASLVELFVPNRMHLTDLAQRYRSLPTDPRHNINLLAYEPVILQHLPIKQLRSLILNRYTIGSWFFELPRAPAWWQNGLGYADEIWTISHYSAQAIKASVSVPVNVIPSVVKPSPATSITRAELGLPDDRFIFYFSFDAKSSFARKNPWAVIESFERAFHDSTFLTSDKRPILLIKARDIHVYPAAHQALKSALGRVNGILIDGDYPRHKVDALLQHCDCYISLHSAEGFGLGMAEAMSLGKPVIATNFSANTDYLNASNGFPVNYFPHEITLADHIYDPNMAEVYEPGQVWAKPDIAHAATLIREVYFNPAESQRRGRQAQQDIAHYCSPAAVAKLVMARLHEIQTQTHSDHKSQIAKQHIFAQIALGNYRVHYEHWLKIHRMIETLPFENHPYLGRIMQIPLVAFLTRYAKRLRWLGHLTYAQHDVNAAALDMAECLLPSVTT